MYYAIFAQYAIYLSETRTQCNQIAHEEYRVFSIAQNWSYGAVLFIEAANNILGDVI